MVDMPPNQTKPTQSNKQTEKTQNDKRKLENGKDDGQQKKKKD